MKILYGKKFYRPREIAEQQLISNSNGDEATVTSLYNHVLWLIRQGELKARNFGRGQVPYYLVSEDEIDRFNRREARV